MRDHIILTHVYVYIHKLTFVYNITSHVMRKTYVQKKIVHKRVNYIRICVKSVWMLFWELLFLN